MGRDFAEGSGEIRRMSSARCGAERATFATSMKLCIFVGINLGGYVGWELGDRYGTMTAFLLSGLGSMLGVIAGWWTARKLFA